MTCENCNPDIPGKTIFTDKSGYCSECGDKVSQIVRHGTISNSWDNYFHRICLAVSSKSPCLSRKIGAILVRDYSIVSTGFNGPSRGIPHCGRERNLKDPTLGGSVSEWIKAYHIDIVRVRMDTECPRSILGYASGTHLELCPAQHAEENAISNAARLGVSTVNTILYMNCIIPCKNCFGTLINAGISEIVVDKVEIYDKHTQYLIDNSNIKIRRFQ